MDAYAYRKSKWSGFSHRYVAQKTGSSSGYFSRILSGNLKLSEQKLGPLLALFQLTREEEEYFTLLHRAEHAEAEVKVELFRSLLRLRGIRLQILEGEEFGIYGAWYLPVLREVLALVQARHWTDAEIGALLSPPLSAEVVAAARSRLLEMGILVAVDGGYKRSERMLSSGDRPHLALRHYADECLALARRALCEEPLDQRELAFVTLSVSAKTQAIVQDKIRNLRRELLEIAAMEDHPDRVIQVQLHSVPVAKPWEERAQG